MGGGWAHGMQQPEYHTPYAASGISGALPVIDVNCRIPRAKSSGPEAP